jgi:hypothetical protein
MMEHNCYIVGRDAGGIHILMVSTGRCAFASAVDDLPWGLNSNGHYRVGYSDDIAILINDKFLQTVSEVLQTALCTVKQWCKRTKLSINPNKTAIIPFTRKRYIKGLKEPILFSKTIQLSSEVKYLGLTLEKGLRWSKQLGKVINKA